MSLFGQGKFDRYVSCVGLACLAMAACTGVAGNAGPTDSGGSGGGEGGTGGSDPVQACEKQKISPRIWKLTTEQYRASVASAFRLTTFDIATFPREGRDEKTGFPNGSANTFVGGPLSNALFVQAETYAPQAAQAAAQARPCLVASAVDANCVRAFVKDVGRRAFRRPITQEEEQRFVDLFTKSHPKVAGKGATEVVVHTMLMSPHMLFRFELGNGGNETELDDYEIASALSFGLTDQPPSDELMAAADAKRLRDPQVRSEFARKLAKTPEARTKMVDFLFWQMGLTKLDDQKAELGEALTKAAVEEVKSFTRQVLQSDDPTLKALYTANHSMINDSLAPIYGIKQTSKEHVRTELPAGERSGIFTQPGWLMATHGPIHRGKRLREMFLCQEIPLPPDLGGDLTMQLPKTPVEWTQREKWDVFVKERAGCAACHAQFEPLGFPFERYDNQGKYRSQNEHGRAIATDGTIDGAEGWSGKFDGVASLVSQILQSPEGRNCFVQRYMTYVLGTTIENAQGSCMTRDVGNKFGEEGLNLFSLMEAGVTHESFVSRAR